jgi:hypothetical protein
MFGALALHGLKSLLIAPAGFGRTPLVRVSKDIFNSGLLAS